MKIRTQLLLAGLLLLILPLVTWKYLREMNEVLLQSGQQALSARLAATETVLQQVAESNLLLASNHPKLDIYAESVGHNLLLDGYTADWSNLLQPAKSFKYADNKSTAVIGSGNVLAEYELKTAVSEQFLYLHFKVNDNKTLYHDPNSGVYSSGDRLELYFSTADGDYKRYVLRAIAPGLITSLLVLSKEKGKTLVVPEPNIEAYWQPSETGYSIEIRAPLPANNSQFGFSLIDVDSAEQSDNHAWIGTVDPEHIQIQGRLRYRAKELERYLDVLTLKASRVRLFDADGWLLAESNRLRELPGDNNLIDPRTSSFSDALLYRFFSWLMQYETSSANALYTLHGPNHLSPLPGFSGKSKKQSGYKSAGVSVVGEIQRLGRIHQPEGFILLETADESIGAIVNSTLVRLFGVFIVLVSLSVTGLFIYASWISIRVKKISEATSNAMQQDGKISSSIPGVRSPDEIGDLSRSVSTLLNRLSSYTDYLRALASRLTHELRTPLAVVSTSLESVQTERLSEKDRIFLKRALGGTQRLQGIIRSLSEATRLEQAVQVAEFEALDLVDWLDTVVPVYRDLYPDRRFSFQKPHSTTSAKIMGSVDLLQQLLDKLISNAVDFSPKSGSIELCLEQKNKHLKLSIFNTGKFIAESIRPHVFDAMVSERENGDDSPHLGLGLYIVKLIADVHGLALTAENDYKRKGVQISLLWPAEAS